MRVIAKSLERRATRNVATSLLFVFITAALAQISFHLPGNPVPVTFQVLGVVLSGLFLGSRLGALAQIEYLALGLAGAPVFSGFSFGPAPFLGPTGGYMIGFVAAAYVTGLLAERCLDLDMKKAFMSAVAGALTIYLFGVCWLYVWASFFSKQAPALYAWALGVLPFIGVDTLKCFIAAATVTGSFKWKR